ncbi:related to RRD1-Resistant to Rapamycin Deletion (protein phosphatase 2A regulator activity) [Serendipita indica DSM 11827]|uniref:Serine/threonine-protein phosphatase 2A activator n=1 Tax=Serendipita indica (strain DSM 11827) TaxID=1109443 RepID=G4TRA6_SERID|nr:related to RRD1-Resistant to Rapamycin Deletion (protein phosphatase 2A regulator activity) [Serendipita indica DSM 11827]
MSSALTEIPELRKVSLTRPIAPPSHRIRQDRDIDAWKKTTGYKDYCLWVVRLNSSVIGQDIPTVAGTPRSQAVNKVVELLDELKKWVDEIPPYGDKQRFGNLAFRDWGKRLQNNAAQLLHKTLPQEYHPAIPLLMPYFMSSFGDFTRLDYGSGHELSFAVFLMGLTLVRFFKPTPDEERHLVVTVFGKYLEVTWYLQDVYRLEPAGSHGVWGLDDYHFLGFLWGSAQLRGQSSIAPSSVLNPPLSPTNLYNMQVSRIYQLKIGPFFEHSAQLHAIATGVPNWDKVNAGMLKMYEAEVLNKRVVVQHLPLGGLLAWD